VILFTVFASVLIVLVFFLAACTNGRGYACVRLSSVWRMYCAKLCVLEQMLLHNSLQEEYMRNRLVPK